MECLGRKHDSISQYRHSRLSPGIPRANWSNEFCEAGLQIGHAVPLGETYIVVNRRSNSLKEPF